MQRLFSTFADGWPGIGLLLLRLLTSVALIYFGVTNLREAPPLAIAIVQVIAVGAGMLVLVGLWTPIAGALVGLVNVWLAVLQCLSHSGDPWIPIMLACLGAALAMLGPGAWSVDARLFGRKHIDFLER